MHCVLVYSGYAYRMNVSWHACAMHKNDLWLQLYQYCHLNIKQCKWRNVYRIRYDRITRLTVRVRVSMQSFSDDDGCILNVYRLSSIDCYALSEWARIPEHCTAAPADWCDFKMIKWSIYSGCHFDHPCLPHIANSTIRTLEMSLTSLILLEHECILHIVRRA